MAKRGKGGSGGDEAEEGLTAELDVEESEGSEGVGVGVAGSNLVESCVFVQTREPDLAEEGEVERRFVAHRFPRFVRHIVNLPAVELPSLPVQHAEPSFLSEVAPCADVEEVERNPA